MSSSQWSRSGGPPLSTLSDGDLQREAQRRRRARRGESDVSPPRDQRQVAQWLANLELSQRASRNEVEDAYQKLVTKYGAAAEAADGPKKKAADKLLSSLGEAYRGLLDYFEK